MAAQEWASQGLRQMVVQQIEDTSRKFGNISMKTSQEYEQQILDKAQSRDDYLQMVARLILHIKEVRGKGGQINVSGNQTVSVNVNVNVNQLTNVTNQNQAMMQQQQQQQQQISNQQQQMPNQQQQQQQQQQQKMNGLAQQLMPNQMNNMRPNQMMQQNMAQMNSGNRSNDISQNIVAGQPMQVTLQGGQIISQRGAGMINQHQVQQSMQNNPNFMNQMNATASSVAMSGQAQMPITVQQPGMMQKQLDPNMMTQQQFAKLQMMNQRNQQQQQQQQQMPQQMQQQQNMNNVNLQGMPSSAQNYAMSHASSSKQQKQVMQPSPAKSNIHAPSPQQQQPAPSPSQQSPAFVNPPSVGLSPSPLTQADEIMYADKLKEMSKFIEPLKKLVRQMPNNDELKKENAKMTGLLDIITKKRVRVQLAVLNQCEDVLKRLFPDAVNNAVAGTPETHNNMDQAPTPIRPPPMREVVTNIITSGNLMSQTRQNILPGVLALNAPMIHPPPPLPKSRKRSYAETPTDYEQKKSPLPHALQMEIVHLVQNFNIKVDQTQSADKAGVTLICESKDMKIPPMACSMSVRVPGNYPKTEPGYFLKDFGNSHQVSEVRDRMTKKLMRLPYTRTFSSILKAWEQSLIECFVT